MRVAATLAIVALGMHHPPTGRIEPLDNDWEALVRRGRGYRDLDPFPDFHEEPEFHH